MIIVADGWRRCCRCRQFKPVGQFNAKRRWPNGWPRTRQSYCKTCARQRNRELNGWAPRRPPMLLTESQRLQRRRNRQRENRERLREEDPQAWAAYLATRRMDAKLSRERQRGELGREYPLRKQVAGAFVPERYVGPSPHETLPAAPLVEYLGTRFPGFSGHEIAAYCHGAISERLLTLVLSEGQERIELDAADRMLTIGLGRPDLLNTLYPIELP